MENTIEKLINEQNIFNKIFLFYGEEKYFKDMYISKIKKIFGELQKGINYITLDETNVSNMIYEANTPAFGYNNKLIIINNSGLFKVSKKNSDDEVIEKKTPKDDDIISFIEKNNFENVTIIFNETDVAKNKKIYKVIDKNGIVNEFNKLKENEIVNYAINLCNKYNVKLSKETATYFVSICLNNMEDIINELRKLIEYTGSENEITKEYIDLITTKSMYSIIFDLTDYLGKKETKKAISILDDLLKQKEPIQMIYLMLYRHFRSIYLIKYAQEHGIQNINDALGLHPFVYSKCCTQSKNFTLMQLTRIFNQLNKLDLQNKSGNMDIYNGIINVICTIN